MNSKIIVLFLILSLFSCKDSVQNFTNSTIMGLDFSNQTSENLDWKSVKVNYRFVISRSVRAVDINPNKGQHTWQSITDSNFARNWKDLATSKITRGAYHLFSPEVSGAEQYRVFKETVDFDKGDLPPILDAITHDCDLDEAFVWLNLAAKDCNCTPIIYTDEKSIDKISRKFPQYNLWLDTPNEKTLKRLKKHRSSIVLWQYKKDIRLKGFPEFVDLNQFLGEEKDFQDLLLK